MSDEGWKEMQDEVDQKAEALLKKFMEEYGGVAAGESFYIKLDKEKRKKLTFEAFALARVAGELASVIDREGFLVAEAIKYMARCYEDKLSTIEVEAGN